MNNVRNRYTLSNEKKEKYNDVENMCNSIKERSYETCDPYNENMSNEKEDNNVNTNTKFFNKEKRNIKASEYSNKNKNIYNSKNSYKSYTNHNYVNKTDRGQNNRFTNKNDEHNDKKKYIHNKRFYNNYNMNNSEKYYSSKNKEENGYINSSFRGNNYNNRNSNKNNFNHNLNIDIDKQNNKSSRYRNNEYGNYYNNENTFNKINKKNDNTNDNNFSNIFKHKTVEKEDKFPLSNDCENIKSEEHFNLENTDINSSGNYEYNKYRVQSNPPDHIKKNDNFLFQTGNNNFRNECNNTHQTNHENCQNSENNENYKNESSNQTSRENSETSKTPNKETYENGEHVNGNISSDLNKDSNGNANEDLKKLKREEEKKKVKNWKPEEQALLEEGLRVYKDLKNSPQKWEKVSQIVKTKNSDECLKRFLYCRFVVMKEKEKLEKERIEKEKIEKEKIEKEKLEKERMEKEKLEEENDEHEQDIDSDDMDINNNINVKGKNILLKNVYLKNISLYKAVLLKFQLVCTRCCNTFDVTVTSKDQPQIVCNCTNCSSNAIIEVYRNICFLGNSCICVLKFNQCSLMDLLAGDYSINCEGCGRKTLVKNVSSGKEICVNCQNCFIKLEFRYEEFSFDESFTANDAAIKKIDDMINKLFTSKTSKKKIVAPQSNNLKIEKTKSVVKINNIEVKDGACKHYKKSHKLFKFPCCNKIFPCPTCHNLNSNHEYVLARRVICGYCYREFDDDDVCICQKDKKTKKGGNFWEGGKGCRNAITLSRNDSKKYKLLNRQTVQKKKK
ncbi:zinc finger protein, putative [Plasmodium vinckei lentum]|uniref:Zinc finger protein, putative n=1 Tax=Plasmodium vinckei lentum TaxID=138297 RepID=A0A6V7S2G0_PLAVN|nr:zinc finger protein, putative [Plasmodium vinckei lentum]